MRVFNELVYTLGAPASSWVDWLDHSQRSVDLNFLTKVDSSLLLSSKEEDTSGSLTSAMADQQISNRIQDRIINKRNWPWENS